MSDVMRERFARAFDTFLDRSPLSSRKLAEAARRHGIGYSTLQTWRTGEHLPRVPEDNPGLVSFLHEAAASPEDARRVLDLAKTAWREAVRAKKSRGRRREGFVGRTAQRRLLGGHLSEPGAVVVIWGPGGVGKSALARRLVEDVSAEQRLDVDLRGSGSEPLTLRHALAELLAPGVSGRVDTMLAAYRNVAGARRTALLLDDAADAPQVLPLLTPAPDCVTVITSRDPLAELEGHGALRLRLGALEPAESRELLAAVVDAGDVELGRLAELCGHQPLALHVAAGRFTGPATAPIPPGADVIRHAYDLLPAPERDLFRRLSGIPGFDITAPAAAALADVTVSEAERSLARLANARLVERRNDRFRLHDVLRLFGRSLAGEDDPALCGLAVHYGVTTLSAARRIFPDLRALVIAPEAAAPTFGTDHEASRWLAAERHNLVATAAAVREPGLVPFLADALRALHQVRPHGLDWTPIAGSALRAADEPRTRAAMSVAAGMANWGVGRLETAAERFTEAVAGYRVLRLPGERASALHVLGAVEHALGRLDGAREHCAQALRLRRRLGERRGQASSLVFLGDVCADLGLPDRAARHATEALALAEESGYNSGTVGALGVLARVREEQGRFEEAWEVYARQLELSRELGFGSRQAIALVGLARTAHRRGHHEEAVARAVEAGRIARDSGNPIAVVDAENVAGAAHLDRGRPTEAGSCHRTALAAAQSAGYRRGAAVACAGLATALRAYDVELAETYARHAVELGSEVRA